MEKKRYNYFEIAIVSAYIIIFLISFTYKLGIYYYDILPWMFFAGMIASLGSVIGILTFPLALEYQTFFYNEFTFLPLGFTTLYFILIAVLLISIIGLKKEKVKNDANLYLIFALGMIALIVTVMNGFNIGFGNSAFAHYLEGILIVLLIGTFVSTKRKLRLFSWMLLLAIGSLAFRLYNHTYSYDIALPGFENNYLARVFSFYVPFLLGMFWAEKKKHLKFLVLIAFLFMAQGVTQVGSRATYLSIGIALPLMILWNIKKKSTWGILGLGLIFLLFFASPLFINDVKSIPLALAGTESEDASIQGRALVAEYGWEVFKQKPIIGHGVYPNLFENMMLKEYDWFKSGHNSYVIIAVEMGIFGLVTYLLLFAASIFNCYKAQLLSKNKDNYLYYTANGTMFGLIAIGINQFMINNPWIPTVFIGFGLSSALYYLARTGHKGRYEIPKLLIILLVLLLILAIFLFLLYLLLSAII